ncbi:MAG: hypothetical protein B1H08_02395 [Candidatus Omnitrophica bacterium 4484_171]|nr:MAG: hypothetical protein B1H08_02395 [Candidatus Omnitrophica bacterium 4484_171]
MGGFIFIMAFSNINPVITGIGVVAPNGIGKDEFWKAQELGKYAIGKISSFDTGKFNVNLGAQIRNFNAKEYLGPRGLRNLDRSALFLLVGAKQAIEDSDTEVTDATTDNIGVVTGTTFSHFWPIIEFDREVFKEGIDFASPALFPSTVINAASSMVSIRFNIQGLNATISTGYTSGLEALNYSIDAINAGNAERVFAAGVDSLTFSLFFGFHKLGYMAGIKGEPLSCPFDSRRNGPVLGEAAGVLCIEDMKAAKKRGVPIVARIRGVTRYFDGYRIGKIHPHGLGISNAIKKALDEADILPEDIDYISSCANSSQDLDRIESAVLKEIFGKRIKNIPVSSIKSMIGETFSPSGILQVISCIGAMNHSIIPPTINYKEPDPECDIDCVPNKAQKKDVRIALVTSFGPGGYNSACILEKA